MYQKCFEIKIMPWASYLVEACIHELILTAASLQSCPWAACLFVVDASDTCLRCCHRQLSGSKQWQSTGRQSTHESTTKVSLSTIIMRLGQCTTGITTIRIVRIFVGPSCELWGFSRFLHYVAHFSPTRSVINVYCMMMNKIWSLITNF